jgi:hypothetical protein
MGAGNADCERAEWSSMPTTEIGHAVTSRNVTETGASDCVWLTLRMEKPITCPS